MISEQTPQDVPQHTPASSSARPNLPLSSVVKNRNNSIKVKKVKGIILAFALLPPLWFNRAETLSLDVLKVDYKVFVLRSEAVCIGIKLIYYNI